jgi:hypothetical protein
MIEFLSLKKNYNLEGSLNYIIGFPSFGNYGQFTLDVILATGISVASKKAVEFVGIGESDLLLPLTGYESYQQSDSEKHLSYPMEFYRLVESNIVFVMIRSICRENDEEQFAKELAEFLQSKTYSSAIALTSACPDDWDVNTMFKTSHFFTFLNRKGDSFASFPASTDKMIEKTLKLTLGEGPVAVNQSDQFFPYGMELAAAFMRCLPKNVIILGKFSFDPVRRNDADFLPLPLFLLNELKLFSDKEQLFDIKQLKVPASWLIPVKNQDDVFPIW